MITHNSPRLAAKAKPLRSIVNLNDPRFLNPPDMPKTIQDFCRETKQPVPKTEGELVRCCYESLALIYRETLASLEELTANASKSFTLSAADRKAAY
ncbi:MAG: FGGY-family carbohydrate kinase [Limisphaerales bacterium]